MKKKLIFGGVVLGLGLIGYFLYKKQPKTADSLDVNKDSNDSRKNVLVEKISPNIKKIIEAKRKK